MLLAETLFNIPGLHWETAMPLAIGVAVSGAALIVGRLFLMRRRRYIEKSIEAAAEGEPFADHLAHLAVHGFLHLLGYDHQSDAEAVAMERLEAAILARLGVPDPYAKDGTAT